MQDAFAHCETLVRAADKDRFLATLFAPAQHRSALFALYAFNAEIARIREVAREPFPGEIRLQWWSDVLAGSGRGEVESHPVAAALLATRARYRLPPDRLDRLVESRRFDLYDDPMRSLAELEQYVAATSSNLVGLAAHILRGGREPDVTVVARHVGLAHAVSGLLKAFPVHAARGQLYVPLDILLRHGADRDDVANRRATPQLHAALTELRAVAWHALARARSLIAGVSSEVMPALLPVAPAGAILARMERSSYDPFVPVEIMQWRRQWLIWRAARRPSRMFAAIR
jgi:phytoene synthase